MPDNPVQYNDILTRLVIETIGCCPADWTQGTLTIDCDGKRIDYKLKNDTEPGKAVISELLRDLIDEFYVRMAQGGHAWTQATITYQRNGNDATFKTFFQYANCGSNPTPAS